MSGLAVVMARQKPKPQSIPVLTEEDREQIDALNRRIAAFNRKQRERLEAEAPRIARELLRRSRVDYR